ncbi:NEW3 domain-containing protein [Lederbergia sp. NSJ-179]|uniref:COG1470 family protein n=1 Tax=Lederbergia sp. NSJ-179 TaxID=2931402 RepID=UPI001FCF9DBD|nr:NEW3 domain-containing protein [Lederbergia sp. NSJ-179]MCJ7841164.1 NEW3 domain-containing protein [Lederbergia sp. NSJ-179]
MFKKLTSFIVLFSLLVFCVLPLSSAKAAEGIELFTPYSGISVTPGETINYSFNVINHTSSVQQVHLSLEDVAKDWEYAITSGGWDLQELSVKPGESEDFTIDLTVPLKVDKGTYQFKAIAATKNGGKTELPLSVKISEKGTFKTELTSDQASMEGHSDSSFDYKAELRNRTAEKQTYALRAETPKGWTVDFKVDGKSVSSLTVDTNASKEVTVNVTPAEGVKADTYKIPIKAVNEKTSSDLELEAVITGSYGMELTTPSGKLSDNITAGKSKNMTVVVKNTGTAPLGDVSLTANAPEGWDVTFEPRKIGKINPNQSETIKVNMESNKNAIAGDYVVELKASSPEASSDAQFRIAVKTPLIWGWVGVLIIIAVFGGIFYLIRKYGRR